MSFVIMAFFLILKIPAMEEKSVIVKENRPLVTEAIKEMGNGRDLSPAFNFFRPLLQRSNFSTADGPIALPPSKVRAAEIGSGWRG